MSCFVTFALQTPQTFHANPAFHVDRSSSKRRSAECDNPYNAAVTRSPKARSSTRLPWMVITLSHREDLGGQLFLQAGYAMQDNLVPRLDLAWLRRVRRLEICLQTPRQLRLVPHRDHSTSTLVSRTCATTSRKKQWGARQRQRPKSRRRPLRLMTKYLM